MPKHSFQFHRYISNQKRLLTINEDHMKYYSNIRSLWVSEIFMPNVNETAELMWATYAVSHRTVTNTHLTYVSTMAFFNNSKLQYLWGFFIDTLLLNLWNYKANFNKCYSLFLIKYFSTLSVGISETITYQHCLGGHFVIQTCRLCKIFLCINKSIQNKSVCTVFCLYTIQRKHLSVPEVCLGLL